MYKAFLAVDQNFGIADANGNIPWHLPGDLERLWREVADFSNELLLSRTTWQSIPEPRREKLLGGGAIVSLWTRQDSFDDPRITLVHDLAKLSAATTDKKIAVLGGRALYENLWSEFDQIDLTYIDYDFATVDPLPDPTKTGFDQLTILEKRLETELQTGKTIEIEQRLYEKPQHHALVAS